METEEGLLLPTFEMASNPQIKLSSIKSKYHIFDKIQAKTIKAIQEKEDKDIFQALNVAANKNGNVFLEPVQVSSAYFYPTFTEHEIMAVKAADVFIVEDVFKVADVEVGRCSYLDLEVF